jgi:hypothetical protein
MGIFGKAGIAALIVVSVALSPVIITAVLFDSALNDEKHRERVLTLLSDGQWWRTLDMIYQLKGASRGWLYTLLSQLEQEGLVTSRPDAASEGGREYRLARGGRRVRSEQPELSTVPA